MWRQALSSVAIKSSSRPASTALASALRADVAGCNTRAATTAIGVLTARRGRCWWAAPNSPTCLATTSLPSSPPSALVSRRNFFASKWQKRLGHLLESRRRPPVPEIPETETIEETDHGLDAVRPCKPVLGSKRCGVLAYKIGCMGVWDEWGQKHMVTVCQMDRLRVVKRMTMQKNGYEALQLGLGYRSVHRQKKASIGDYIKAGVGPKHKLQEFRVSSDCFLPVGHHVTARHFVPGQWCFVTGWSKAKGYHGPMKRWGFSGGTSDLRGGKKAHRSHGSMGQKGAGKVYRGKKAAGHMGPDPRVMNAKVFRIESERNLIFLKGPLPGYKGSVVKIYDARGKTALKNKHIRLPHPTFCPMPGVEYPVTIQQPPQERDPFLYPEQPLYQPGE